MKRLMCILLNTGLIISALFGLGHFIIPEVFGWYGYMAEAPRYIVVSVAWINLIMSLMLSGYSVLLLIFQKRIVQKEKVAMSFLGFLVFVYLVKTVMTVVNPWGMNPIADFIEILSSALVFLILLLPFLYAWKKERI